MASYATLSLNIVRFDRLQTIVNEYWRVTVAVLGLSTIVLVNVPSNTVSQHGLASLLEFCGAVGTSVLSSPVQSLALLAMGVCLLPSTTLILTNLTGSTPDKTSQISQISSQISQISPRIYSIPIMCHLGSHDIHVEADCGSPLAPPSLRIHRLGPSPTSFDLSPAPLTAQGSFTPRRLSFEELVAGPQVRASHQSPFFPAASPAPTTPAFRPLPSLPSTPQPLPSTPSPSSTPRQPPTTPNHNWALDSPRSNSEAPPSPAHPSTHRTGRSLDEPQVSQAGPRWQPSMQRIVSGHDLLALAAPAAPTPSTDLPACPTAPPASLPPPPPPPLQPTHSTPIPAASHPTDCPAEAEATSEACEKYEQQQDDDTDMELHWRRFAHPLLDPCPPGNDAVAAAAAAEPIPGTDLHTVVTDQHLLQFAAFLGEASGLEAVQQGSVPPPVGEAAGCLLGAVEEKNAEDEWELLADHCVAGRLRHQGWRRSLRCGLYLYKSATVYEGITPAQLRAFQHDDPQRADWDDATLALAHLPALSTAPAPLPAPPATPPESTYLHCRTRFPKPLAPREYTYARRVWPRPSDGGCYSISRACPHAAHPSPSGRAVAVSDFTSAYLIRAAPPASGTTTSAPAAAGEPSQAPATAGANVAGAAAEMVSVYFEDPHVRPGIMNLAVKKGMWDAVKRNEALLRQHALQASARDILRASAGPAASPSASPSAAVTAFPLPDALSPDDADDDATAVAAAAAAPTAGSAAAAAAGAGGGGSATAAATTAALSTSVLASPAVSWLRNWYAGSGSAGAPAAASGPLPHASSAPQLAAASSSAAGPQSAPLPPVVSFPLAMRDSSVDSMEEAAAAAATTAAATVASATGAGGAAVGGGRRLAAALWGPSVSAPEAFQTMEQGGEGEEEPGSGPLGRQLRSHALVLRRHAALLRDAGLTAVEQVSLHAGVGTAARHAHAVMRAARAHGMSLRRRRRAARVEWVQRALKAVKVVAGLKLMHQVMNPAPQRRLSRRTQVM